MGLDQYLRARTTTLPSKRSRGACNGLFPIGPKDNGTTEIGYWRKAYTVSDCIRETLGIDGAFNLEDKEIDRDRVLQVLSHAETVLKEKAYKDEFEQYDWETTVKAFRKAKKILDSDPDAQIFYMEWY